MNPKSAYADLDFMKALHARPGMYLHSENYLFYRLETFISGLSWAQTLISVDRETDIEFLLNYNRWVLKKILGYDSGPMMFELFLQKSGGDHKKAFARYFSYVDEFKREVWHKRKAPAIQPKLQKKKTRNK